MNIDNIRCFLSLAKCLNFTRAASKEHITQTAMSRKISALEKELDVQLLYRDTRRVELTKAGNEFYLKAQELIKLYDTTLKQVRGAQNSFQTELKLGVGVYDHVLLNRFLGAYVASLQSPPKISCQQFPYPALAKDFEERLFDVILCTDQFEQELLDFNREQLDYLTTYDEEWYLVLHRDNPLAQYKNRVPLEETASHTLITMEYGGVEYVKQFFQSSFPIRDAVFANSFDAKLVMVNANVGFTFAPPFIFTAENHYDNIVLRKTDPPYHTRTFRAYYWKDNPNPVVHGFISRYRKFLASGH